MTLTVPEPVKVPAPEITTAAPGFKIVLAFIVKVPLEATLMLVLTAIAALVLETVRL